MADPKTILVGTVGQGIMRSGDGGESWQRIGINAGIHSDALVRTIVNHPSQSEVLFSGTDKGLYRSEDAGQNWQLQKNAMSDYCVWSIAIDATDPQKMFAGTGTPTPATIFRSTDAGCRSGYQGLM